MFLTDRTVVISTVKRLSETMANPSTDKSLIELMTSVKANSTADPPLVMKAGLEIHGIVCPV